MSAAIIEQLPKPAGRAYSNGGSQASPANSRSNAGAKPSATLRAQPVFERLQDEQGMLDIQQLPEFLKQLDLADSPDCTNTIQSIAGNSKALSQDQAMALVGILQQSSVGGLGPTASSASLTGQGGSAASLSPSRTPLKRALTKQNRSYLETGSLAYDEAVITYIQKLDEHRKKCEAEGRYAEAKAAVARLAELKTAQVARLRQELVNNQQRELEEVNKVYQEEVVRFNNVWDARIAEYEANFAQAVEGLRAAHEEQRLKYEEELVAKRPTRPKPSREYLQQRKVEESLVKSQQYTRAARVKALADELWEAELEATQAAFEAENRLKVTKFCSKQQQEFEALLQRGARGRDELELRRVAETERRSYRFRNVVMELENLHKLEVVQLESFLDAQVLAGKATPLKDDGVFRRKRETLYNTPF